MVFWRALAASFIVGFPVAIAQYVIDLAFEAIFGPAVDLSVPTGSSASRT